MPAPAQSTISASAPAEPPETRPIDVTATVTINPATERRETSERRSADRTMQEVLLQEVVGDRRLHLYPDKQRVERSGDDFASAERGGADEHDLVANGRLRDLAAEHIGRREIRERPFLAPVAQQQVALAVHRHEAVVQHEQGGIDRGDPQRGVAHLVGGQHRRRREARVTWPSSSMRRGARRRMPSASGAAFMKPDFTPGCISIGRLQTALRRFEERLVFVGILRVQRRQVQRVEHAPAAGGTARFEGGRVSRITFPARRSLASSSSGVPDIRRGFEGSPMGITDW